MPPRCGPVIRRVLLECRPVGLLCFESLLCSCLICSQVQSAVAPWLPTVARGQGGGAGSGVREVEARSRGVGATARATAASPPRRSPARRSRGLRSTSLFAGPRAVSRRRGAVAGGHPGRRSVEGPGTTVSRGGPRLGSETEWWRAVLRLDALLLVVRCVPRLRGVALVGRAVERSRTREGPAPRPARTLGLALDLRPRDAEDRRPQTRKRQERAQRPKEGQLGRPSRGSSYARTLQQGKGARGVREPAPGVGTKVTSSGQFPVGTWLYARASLVLVSARLRPPTGGVTHQPTTHDLEHASKAPVIAHRKVGFL